MLWHSNSNASINKMLIDVDSFTVKVESDEIDQLLFDFDGKQSIAFVPLNKENLNAQQRITVLGRFFRWVGSFFEPIWGQYREPHHRENGPYMTS
jgi:hypothetical protein